MNAAEMAQRSSGDIFANAVSWWAYLQNFTNHSPWAYIQIQKDKQGK